MLARAIRRLKRGCRRVLSPGAGVTRSRNGNLNIVRVGRSNVTIRGKVAAGRLFGLVHHRKEVIELAYRKRRRRRSKKSPEKTYQRTKALRVGFRTA